MNYYYSIKHDLFREAKFKNIEYPPDMLAEKTIRSLWSIKYEDFKIDLNQRSDFRFRWDCFNYMKIMYIDLPYNNSNNCERTINENIKHVCNEVFDNYCYRITNNKYPPTSLATAWIDFFS